MNTRKLGELDVSCIGLGGMPMSIQGRPDEAQSRDAIRAAVEAGVTFIDTADVYCLDDGDIGHNERLIASELREMKADHVIVATKGGLRRPGGDWTTDGRPEHLAAACDASLRTLGTDCIPLYQLHAPDDDVPWADSVGAMADLQRAGKVRYVGISNVTVPEIEQARAIVDVASVQNRCNLWDTDSFATGVVDYCRDHGIAFLPHSPVGGFRGRERAAGDQALARIAADAGISPQQVLLAWLLGIDDVVIPIPGASRRSSAASSAAAADIALSAEARATLDRIAGRTD